MSTHSSRQQRARFAVAARQRKADTKAVLDLTNRLGFVGVLQELQHLAFRNIGDNPAWERHYKALSALLHQEQLAKQEEDSQGPGERADKVPPVADNE